ncbi:MAG: geranylgeranyl reductase family protein [Thermoplasmata archaeon]|nr:MAG: geranylgeranyl reductase family protein [Thermoplasmata archaeon]
MIFDVAIVGAGPAGSSVAYGLEKEDHEIVIIDKEKFPRDKPCAGVLPPRIHSEMDLPEELIERRLEGYRIYSPTGFMVESDFSNKGAIVSRYKLDRFLVNRLNNEVKHERILDFKIKDDFVEVHGEKETYKSKLVVGADGVNSIVNKKCFDFPSEPYPKATAAQFVISLPKEKIDRLIGNWFEVYYSIPYGYGWISPQRASIKVGVGGTSNEFKKNVKSVLNKFMKHELVKEKIEGGSIQKMEAHLIPMGGPIHTHANDRTLLVGDAGGFVFPGTGEGIYYAIKSGRIAAGVIHQALKNERYSGNFLGKLYEGALKENGLSSLREVDFIENVLSTPDRAEKYVRKLQKLAVE